MSTSNLGRREFLLRISAAGALTVGAGTVLSACGGGGEGSSADTAPAGDAASTEASCNDVSGLSEQEIAMRNQLQYVDETPNPEQVCTNCALWVAPAEGASCGGCNLIKGPIAPNGYCISWAPQQT